MNPEVYGEQVKNKGGLVVLSGPSGSGKSTICRRLSQHGSVTFGISATTRPRRTGEVEGKDYFFLTRKTFLDKVKNGEFVEYNEVFDNDVLYGSLRSEVEKGLADSSRYYLMELDVQGALNLAKQNYKGAYIFVMSPSLDELRRRLLNRGTDDSVNIEKRLKKADWELQQVEHYDLLVVNDDLDKAVSQISYYLKLD
jgi:guanylate kinase